MTEHESLVAGVTVVENDPQGSNASWQLIYAPGAGSSIRDPFGTFACDRLAELGVPAARFQFPYQEAGSKRPDRAPVLEATWLAVIDAVRRDGLKLVISGRSMGGRFGTIVASKGAKVDGVVAFAYPLHAPGRPEKPVTWKPTWQRSSTGGSVRMQPWRPIDVCNEPQSGRETCASFLTSARESGPFTGNEGSS